VKDLAAKNGQPVEVIYENDQFKSGLSVSAFHKLTAVDKVNAVFVVGSGTGNAVGPLAESKGIIAIAIGASDKKVSAGRKFVFTHWLSPESESRELVKEVERRGIDRIALIVGEHEGTIALGDSLKKELESKGQLSKLVMSEAYSLETRDYKTFLAKARAKGANGVCAAIMPGALSVLARQIRDASVQAEMFGYETFEDAAEVKASGGALIGKWYVNADEPSAAFQQSFKAAYNEAPGWGAGNAYDSVMLLAEGFKRSGHDNKLIADFLRNLKDYQGAAGTYSATGDNRFDLPATVKLVTKDGFVKLKSP